MDNKLTRYFLSLKARIKRRRDRISRYIELKRLSRIRKHSIPSYVHCKNCGEKLQGMYCHKCGQYALDVNQSFWKYINNYLENAYQLDGRVLQTLRFLFTRPGFLTQEYVKGRVSSYVHPLKLYMFVSIVFFSFVLVSYSDRFYVNNADVSFATGRVEADSVVDLQKVHIADSIKAKENIIAQKKQGETKENAKSFYFKMMGMISKYIPFIIIFLMPFYAYILYRLNRKKSIRDVYLHSFVFSIHTHTLFLILMTFIALVALFFEGFEKWGSMVLLPLFVLYSIVATKIFYRRGWIVSILKSSWSIFLYGLVLLICLTTALIFIIINTASDMKYI